MRDRISHFYFGTHGRKLPGKRNEFDWMWSKRHVIWMQKISQIGTNVVKANVDELFTYYIPCHWVLLCKYSFQIGKVSMAMVVSILPLSR